MVMHYAPPGHLYHISSITLSNDATADFVLQNSTYKSYLFMLENVVPATDGPNFLCRTSTDGGSNYDAGASDYDYVVEYKTATGDAFTGGAATSIAFMVSVGSDVQEALNGQAFLNAPGDASYTRIIASGVIQNTTPTFYRWESAGQRRSAADVDAVRFLFSSGNLESGAIRMYGLRAA